MTRSGKHSTHIMVSELPWHVLMCNWANTITKHQIDFSKDFIDGFKPSVIWISVVDPTNGCSCCSNLMEMFFFVIKFLITRSLRIVQHDITAHLYLHVQHLVVVTYVTLCMRAKGNIYWIWMTMAYSSVECSLQWYWEIVVQIAPVRCDVSYPAASKSASHIWSMCCSCPHHLVKSLCNL